MDLLKGKGVETLGDSSSYVQVDEEGAEREIDRTRRLSVQVNDPILDHDNDKNKKKRKKKKKKQKEKEAEVGNSRLGNETHYNHNSNQDGRGSGGDENTSLTTGARLLRLKNAIQENLISFFEENWWLFLFGAVLSVLLLFCGIFVWNDLSWEAWLTIAVVMATVLVLVKDVLEPYVVLFYGVAVLLAFKIIEPKEALEGFGNPGVIVIAVLFIVAEGIRRSGVLDSFIKTFLGKPKSVASAQFRIMLPVIIASAFLNNTPVVAMLIPVVEAWAKRTGINSTKLLMPLSYAALLGGTCTLIGTSGNLIVVGLAEDKDPDFERLNIFEISLVGVPVAIAGMVYMILASRWLLPIVQTDNSGASESPREYATDVLVTRKSGIADQSVGQGGLPLKDGDLHLAGIYRNGETIASPSEDTIIREGDTLLLLGSVSAISSLWNILPPATDQLKVLARLTSSKRNIMEASIAPHSPVVGKNVLEAAFVENYKAAIVGVHRYGKPAEGLVDMMTVEPGDTLLLVGHPSFVTRFNESEIFGLIRNLGETTAFRPVNIPKMAIGLALGITMIALTSAEVLPLLSAAMATACAMIVLRSLSLNTAHQAVNVKIILIIASAFGLANALENTGAASRMADTMLSVLEPLGPLGILFGVFIATATMSAFISNAAAVTLMFPIIYALVEDGGVSLKAALYTLMLAASASFSTPVGYQTNLMVAAAAGYRFFDFVRFGLPLTLVSCVTTVLLSWVIWN